MRDKINFKNNNRGITLVALIITVIVLLILAGVAISTVIGNGGLLSKSKTSVEVYSKEQAKEKLQMYLYDIKMDIIATRDTKVKDCLLLKEKEGIEKIEFISKASATATIVGGEITDPEYAMVTCFSFTFKVNSKLNIVSEEGSGGAGGGPVSLTYSGATTETVPYLPNSNCSFKTGTSLSNGLVMVDENSNEWVWIEVPKSITASATTDEAIYTALDTYAHGTTESPIITKYATYYSDTWKNGDSTITLSGVITEATYNTNKSKMLQSIKANGGFWVGRYETGIASGLYRTEKTDASKASTAISKFSAVIQQNAKPYNYVTCKEAEELSEGLKPAGTNTSTLMYGIQWDLVLRYLYEKTATTGLSLADINTDSKSWGNYSNATISLNRGQYDELDMSVWQMTNNWQNITVGNKSSNSAILLTTGASDAANKMNIYDIAGNEIEWTLERCERSSLPCVGRGGNFGNNGGNIPASIRNSDATDYSNYNFGFRPSLY